MRLNVGGRIFSTTRDTLTRDPNSMLVPVFWRERERERERGRETEREKESRKEHM